MSDQLKNLIAQNYEHYFSSLVSFERITGSREAKVMCPVHGDSKESLSINLDTGEWYCFGCATGGGPIQFYSFLYGVDNYDAIDDLNARYNLVPVPTNNVKAYHNSLLSNTTAMQYLLDRGITEETISKFQLGFDGKRLHIPQFDAGGLLRNVRQHLITNVNEIKTLSSFEGTGGLRIFPLIKATRELYLFEGEMDCLLAISLGLNAYTITGGAGSWNLKFNKYFADKKVIICYDVDKAGTEGAIKVAKQLYTTTKDIYIISLPKEYLPDNGDFTDYIKELGFGYFMALPRVPFNNEEVNVDSAIMEVHLAETIDAGYYNKKIRTTGIPTGKGDLFIVPKKLRCVCKSTNNSNCTFCKIYNSGMQLDYTIESDSIVNIEFCRADKEYKVALIKKLLQIPEKCNYPRVEILEATNVEEVVLIPEIDFKSTVNMSYISRVVYIVSPIPVESNKPYVFEGTVLPNPKSQKSTILINKVTPTKDNIDQFEMTDVIHNELKMFQATTSAEIIAKLQDKYKDYANITGITGRNYLFMGADLCFHSALGFTFQNKLVKRGYVDCLIFGDTRTGKSDTIDALINHFRAGDTASGENVSFAGLVGGVHKTGAGEKWGITWKIIPLNDRRFVKIDEFDKMNCEDIPKMTDMMSSGVASIQKIHSEKTMARVRLMFLANCKNERGSQNLSSYQYGVQAIPPLMAWHNEDIARLDFAIAVSSSDVPLAKINEFKQKPKESIRYTSDLCHNLVMWAWSRKHSDIVFVDNTEHYIAERAIAYTETYHSSIALVPPAEFSIKLARLAVSCAIMMYSTNDGVKVLVTKEHVNVVCKFLDQIYTAKTMQFDSYSKTFFCKDKLKDVKQIDSLNITNDVKELLLTFDKITSSNIQTIFNVDRDLGRVILFTLLKNNAIAISNVPNTYVKTPAFIEYLTTIDNVEKPDDF